MAIPSFPTIVGPRPLDFERFSPENQSYIIELERRGLRDVPCPDCRMKGKRLFRCHRHRTWGR